MDAVSDEWCRGLQVIQVSHMSAHVLTVSLSLPPSRSPSLQATGELCDSSVFVPMSPGSHLDPTTHADSLSRKWWRKQQRSDHSDCEWYSHPVGVPAAAMEEVFQRCVSACGHGGSPGEQAESNPPAARKSALLGGLQIGALDEIVDALTYGAVSRALYVLT